MSDEPQTLAEALGVDPDEISEQLRRDFDRIREAEREAHIAASQIWLDAVARVVNTPVGGKEQEEKR